MHVRRWAQSLGVGTCVLVILAAAPAPALAQVCGTTYLSPTPTGGNTTLTSVDTSTNPWTFNSIGTADVPYNAMAYRPANDTLYAIQVGTNTLLEIDASDGSVTALGAVADLPTASYHVGAFAPDGFMYVRTGSNDTTLYLLDVDALDATPIALSAPLSVADLSWFNGLFYGVGTNGLQSVSTSGTVTDIGTFPGGFGAMISASNGVFGVRNNGSGAYQFDVTTGLGTLVSDAPAAPGIDGARCLDAPLLFDADLTVTKTDGTDTYVPGDIVVYTIVVTNNGPFGVQNAEVSDPLPPNITTAAWTCTGVLGVCGAAAGTGAIVDTPDLPVSGSVTYTHTLTVPPALTGDLVDTVSVALPSGFTDPTPDDNVATDLDVSAVSVPALPLVALLLAIALVSAAAARRLRRQVRA